MSNINKSDSTFINKAKNYTPIACNTKREEAEQGSGKVLCVEAWVVRVNLQKFNERGEFQTLYLGEFLSALNKLRMIDDINHFSKVQQGKIFYQCNVWSVFVRHFAICA